MRDPPKKKNKTLTKKKIEFQVHGVCLDASMSADGGGGVAFEINEGATGITARVTPLAWRTFSAACVANGVSLPPLCGDGDASKCEQVLTLEFKQYASLFRSYARWYDAAFIKCVKPLEKATFGKESRALSVRMMTGRPDLSEWGKHGSVWLGANWLPPELVKTLMTTPLFKLPSMTALEERIGERLFRVLLPHQREGVLTMIAREGRMYLADEPGLGKTLQAYVSAVALQAWPLVIVGPTTTKSEMKRMLQAFLWVDPRLFYEVPSGKKFSAERLRLAQGAKYRGDDGFVEFPNGTCVRGVAPPTPSEAAAAAKATTAAAKRKRGKAKTTVEPVDDDGFRSAVDGVPKEAWPALVTVVTYDLLAQPVVLKAIQGLKAGGIAMLVGDEAQAVAHAESHRTRAFQRVALDVSKFVLAMSGTPLNFPINLYSQLFALRPQLFPRLFYRSEREMLHYKEAPPWMRPFLYGERYVGGKYVTVKGGRRVPELRGEANSRELHHVLSRLLVLRRTKKQAGLKLPRKNREKVVLTLSDVTRQQAHMAKLSELREAATAKGTTPDKNETNRLFTQMYSELPLLKLRAVLEFMCNLLTERNAHWDPGPRGLLDPTILYSILRRRASAPLPTDVIIAPPACGRFWTPKRRVNSTKVKTRRPVAKTRMSGRILRVRADDADVAEAEADEERTEEPKEELRSQKVIFFAYHVPNMLDQICSALSLLGCVYKQDFVVIRGGISKNARAAAITQFQTDPRCRFAVLGITSGGVGITLHASWLVVFCELMPNVTDQLQAEDRVHRIGQKRESFILYLIANGTLDVCLWRMNLAKYRTSKRVLEDSRLGFEATMRHFWATVSLQLSPDDLEETLPPEDD